MRTYQITNLGAEAVEGLSALRYSRLVGLRDLCELVDFKNILPSGGMVGNEFFVTTSQRLMVEGVPKSPLVKSLTTDHVLLHTWLLHRDTNSLPFLLLVGFEEALIHVPVVNTIDDTAS